ncbi:MAG: hypothetical protein AAB368_13895, partial [bacterium]
LNDARVQVYAGVDIWEESSGGCMIHASDGRQTGIEFWSHMSDASSSCVGGSAWGSAFDVFCPKGGMIVEAVTSTAVTRTYTTTVPDQCVVFYEDGPPSGGNRTNYRIRVLPAGSQSDAVALYTECDGDEKFYTAPFLQLGTYYVIIAPPVVYSGQSFWITVVVTPQGGGTKTDYCGITSFSSTDPVARIEGAAMGGYDYAWDTADSKGSPCAVGVPCKGGACTACTGGCDNGVSVLVNVSLTQLGLQTIVASDTLDGSIVGLTTVQVVGADIKLTKMPPLQVSASGDTVQFQICWSNYSTATGSAFTITDAVPNGTVYLPDVASSHYCGATKGFGAATVAYSTNGGAAYTTLPAGGTAATPVTHLRWTIPTVGVATT